VLRNSCPLTPAEFEVFKARRKAERDETVEAKPDDLIVAKAWPNTADHSMDLYLQAIEKTFPTSR